MPAGQFYGLMMGRRVDEERGSSPGWLDDDSGDGDEGKEGGVGEDDGEFLSRE